jgi:hypothetical protein
MLFDSDDEEDYRIQKRKHIQEYLSQYQKLLMELDRKSGLFHEFELSNEEFNKTIAETFADLSQKFIPDGTEFQRVTYIKSFVENASIFHTFF